MPRSLVVFGPSSKQLQFTTFFLSPVEFKWRQPLVVSAIKAKIGHSGAAAGVVSLIKAFLMLHRDTIAPQPNQPIKLNPKLRPILGPGADIQLANGQRWQRNGTKPRCIFLNNFDTAGGNVSVFIHEAPISARLPPTSESNARTCHDVVTSGRTEAAQEQNKENLQKYLLQHPETQLASLAYTPPRGACIRISEMCTWRYLLQTSCIR